MLYHMLSGRSPLSETRDRIKRLSVARYRDVKPLGQLVPNVPNYVIAFINKAMDLKPERRYQTPSEMMEDLNKILKRVKAGDKGVLVTREATEPEAPDDSTPVNDTPLEREGEARTIMLVERSVNMQDTIRKALKKRGYRVLVFGSPSRAFQRFEDHLEPEPLADCIIFSAGDLGGEAVDAFNKFGEAESTRSIPAILLVNRSDKEQIRRAKPNDHRILLPLGLKIKQLRARLLQLLREAEPSSS
jgi:PleD family two-component response regulator